MPKTYFWLLFAVVAWAATFFLVPVRKSRGLLSVGFWGGLVLTVILQLVFEYWMGLYRFHFMLWPILGFSLMLPFMWFAETVLFVNYWPKTNTSKIIYVLAFSTDILQCPHFIPSTLSTTVDIFYSPPLLIRHTFWMPTYRG